MRRLLTAALATVSLASAASAADITRDHDEQRFALIHITGDIVAGDDEKLSWAMSLAQEQGVAIMIQLASPGGAGPEAIAMGYRIKAADAWTYVAPNDHCDSACTLIWIAGKKRYADGPVSFHRPYYLINGKMVPVPISKLEGLRNYWHSMRMSDASWRIAMEYAPWEGLIVAGPGAN